MSDIVERLTMSSGITSMAEEIVQLKAEIERLRAEITDWHECAKFDVLMEGPRAMGWNRSALERCREKYVRRG